MAAPVALKLSLLGHYDRSPLDTKRLPLHQGRGRFTPRRLDNPAEGLAGYTHDVGGFVVVEPLVVGEA
jgi:hypothetical protein